jgi:hypothetical protein
MGDFTRKFDDNSKEKIDVTCLVVTGNRAVAGGPRPGQANPDATFYLIVEDNGPDGDLMSTASTSTPADQAGCVSADIFVGGSLFPVDGDFTVNDAIP